MASLKFYSHLFANFPGAKDACMPIKLTIGGTLISRDVVQENIQDTILLTPYCPLGSVYIYDLNRLFRDNFHILTSSTAAWMDIYRVHDGYAYSIPVFVSIITIAMAISVAMSGFMTIAKHSRFPKFLRFGVYFATAETIAIFGLMIKYLYDRYKIGGNAVALTVLELITKPHLIASFVATALLQFALVQVTVQLFQRDIERKCVVACGLTIVITSVVLSGVSFFAVDNNQVLTAFHYLLEMSIYLLFSVCVCLRGAESWQAAFSKELFMLTCITFMVSWLPSAFYVADFCGWWHARMIDQLCPFSTVMCAVTGWYWIQKLYDVEQRFADGHQLGRRVVNKDSAFKTFQYDDGDAGLEGADNYERKQENSKKNLGLHRWAASLSCGLA